MLPFQTVMHVSQGSPQLFDRKIVVLWDLRQELVILRL